MERILLKDKIISDSNIFSAINCLESYVFEKGLLDSTQAVVNDNGDIIAKNDLELYYRLSDKYDMELMESVIAACRARLSTILDDKEKLFEATVYFKAKKYDEENKKIVYRPMHTARLLDLICMVSILNCLMFEDENNRRCLSDLSKLLPHNFYGNIPSTNVDSLFVKWQMMYKSYTRDIITHCREYQQNHKYLTEVNLDIKNFFPSIPPKYLFEFIIGKLSSTYRDEKDKYTLRMAVAKLLYFKLSPKNIEPWVEEYYPEGWKKNTDNFYLNCGIPQGLPQSYFFGNLCMIEVKKKMLQEDCFPGDAYFYVDDSVIYVQASIKPEAFKTKIEALNKNLSEWCDEVNKQDVKQDDILSGETLLFQKTIDYKISFHKEGKSTICHIDDADNHLDGLQNMDKTASDPLMNAFYLDEIDDKISSRKLEALDEVISKEIERLEEKRASDNEGKQESKNTSRLKLLRRYKKFFLYRNKRLKLKTEEISLEEMENDFNERMLKTEDINAWFKQNEEDIFQSQYRLLLEKETADGAKIFAKRIEDFEKENFGARLVADGKHFLYYSKDVENSLKMKRLSVNLYDSLKQWIKENFCGVSGLGQEGQMEKFRSFVFGDGTNGTFCKMLEKGFREKKFSCFVLNASDEYKRKILNAYYSSLLFVDVSDSCSFIKKTSREMRYTELRILSYLRNKHFEFPLFKNFVHNLNEKDISNKMRIDLQLLEVLATFISKIRNPEWVDTLIITHRIVKGLWYNGSKFLNAFTLHNEEHAVTLIKHSVDLVNRIDYFSLKKVDYYILFLACYLHDISMVIHPDLGSFSSEKGYNVVLISSLMDKMQKEANDFYNLKTEENVKAEKNDNLKQAGNFIIDIFNQVYAYFENNIRSHHPADSANFIRGKASSLLNYLSPTLLSFVAKVSESHGYDVLEVYGLKSRAQNDTVSLKYMMMLIRLADLLDVSNDRVNYHLLGQNLKNLSETSRFHWISHLVTDNVVLNVDYKVDPEKKLVEKPITEIINLELYLNVKYLTAFNPRKACDYCFSQLSDDCITISIVGNKKECCNSEVCTFLCKWMMEKHYYLIQELAYLKDYLFSVNNSMIQTEINFKIFFCNDMKLDADMFDSVRDFLEKQE